MLMGLLSSGRGFHISAPFLSVYLSLQRETNSLSGTPVADQFRSLMASLLLYLEIK
jgi:hypothetical protein